MYNQSLSIIKDIKQNGSVAGKARLMELELIESWTHQEPSLKNQPSSYSICCCTSFTDGDRNCPWYWSFSVHLHNWCCISNHLKHLGTWIKINWWWQAMVDILVNLRASRCVRSNIFHHKQYPFLLLRKGLLLDMALQPRHQWSYSHLYQGNFTSSKEIPSLDRRIWQDHWFHYFFSFKRSGRRTQEERLRLSSIA